jgi:hypothetical protein
MNIADLTKRHLFGSIDKSKIPGTLADYNCDLVIEEYEQVHFSLLRDAFAQRKSILDSPPSNIKRMNPSLL